MSDTDIGEETGTPQRRSRLRGGFYWLLSLCANPISVAGLLLVAVAMLLGVTLALFIFVTESGSPYLGVVAYLVLPGVFLVGLAIVPLGVVWKRWRLRHGGQRAAPEHKGLDLNDPRARIALVLFLGITFFIVLPGIAVSSYHGYLYTESTAFCAELCHNVMEPQGTAHANSPHARVSCAACHIGEGAGWFAQSKLSGTRQVLAVWRDNYSRPIAPAITELRPARETCEECHWPEKFFGSQLKEVIHYAPDGQNTRRVVRMLLKTGGADETIGRVEGIHMHMMASGRVEYVALDEYLQEIPWVRYVRTDGRATVYRADGQPHSDPPPRGIVRTVDCMDCHNRGAHHFRSPESAVNYQLEAGRIDVTLPFIKREVVAALVGDYADVATADAEIERMLTDFYQTNYPDVVETRPEALREAIVRTQEIYRRNFFPHMKVSWQTYPENIGHMISPGCLRCHDGLHVDEQGQTISSDCEVCHTFLNALPDRPHEFRQGRFEHSMGLGLHRNLRCNQCHTGGPLPLCRSCHDQLKGLLEWTEPGRLRQPGN
ncbi:MAG: cytochrome C [Planctomycetota bacterium]